MAVVYELYAVYVAIRAIRGDRLPPPIVRYRNALIETSLPTLFLVLAIAANSPPELYIIPVAWLYFLLMRRGQRRLASRTDEQSARHTGAGDEERCRAAPLGNRAHDADRIGHGSRA